MDHGGGNCSKNNNHLSWDFWEVGSSRFDWNSFSAPSSSSSSLPTTATRTTTTRTTTATATATCSSDLTSLHFTNFSNHRPTTPSEMHPFHLHNPTLFKPQQNHHHNHHNQQDQEPTGTHFSSSSSSSSSSFILPHSHFFSNNSSDSLTCLKLGKRQYFEDSSEPTTDQHVTGFSLGKKNRQASPMAFATAAASVAVPRCQVEGCNVGLLNAKEYHKRHKVCEMHSKAPNVVVLGIEQRFCQQCSRFHVVSEFDDSKRSCRRRLAGHNERRRKNSSDSINRNHSQDEWWMNFGIDDLELQNLAIRILSQTCSSSGCERNWSVFERIHTKRRNRLEHKRLNDLVYTHYNLRLKERQSSRKSLTDPISLENIDLTDDWVVEAEDDDALLLDIDEIDDWMDVADAILDEGEGGAAAGGGNEEEQEDEEDDDYI